jgi:aryl-alcohol dehydrogenase-like predicted oxidoreductase
MEWINNFIKVKGMDKSISPIIIGTASPLFFYEPNSFGGYVSKETAYRVLDQLWERGLHTYDCAAGYGEAALGEYLESRKRTKEAVILTKCCHPNPYRKRVTRYDLLSDLHDSLAKLKTDCIDIYVLHRDDSEVPVSEIINMLNEVKKEGKVNLIGASNWSAKRVKEANEYAVISGLEPFTVTSPNYSLAHQLEDPWGYGCETITGSEHKQDREWYQKQEMPILAYSPLARGFFSGAFKSNEATKAEALLDEPGKKGYLYDENFERLSRAEELAVKYGCKVAQIALAWLFSQKLKVIPILSARSVERFDEAIKAKQIHLTDEEIKWINLE